MGTGNGLNTTIVAIASPPGRGAVAVIRMTGPLALKIYEKIFDTAEKGKGEERKAVHGWLLDSENDKIIDEVIAVVYKRPRSYTGEDLVEFFTHGGLFHTRNIYQFICRQGAHPARPGEFTKRAFLNGKMDLTRAEAVEEIVSATDRHTHEAALRQLEGVFHSVLDGWKNSLVEILSSLEAHIEYPEENNDKIDRKGMAHRCMMIAEEINEISVKMVAGRVFKQRPRVVIVGKTNTGKSSLFNTLIGQARSIVSDEQGTTRDVVHEKTEIGGIPVDLYDTAGFKNPETSTEEQALGFTNRFLEESDLLLVLLDFGDVLDEQDRKLLEVMIKKGKKSLICLNKTDLPKKISEKELENMVKGYDSIHISLKEGEGIDRLNEKVREFFVCEDLDPGPVVYSERYVVLFNRMKALLEKTSEGFLSEEKMDVLSIQLKEAVSVVEDFTGKVTSEDVLDNLFSRFCLGK